MEAVKRDQRLLRAKFMKLADDLDAEIVKEEFLVNDVKFMFMQLEDAFRRLSRLSEEVLDLMKADVLTLDATYEAEFNLAENDRDRLYKLKVLVESELDTSKTTKDLEVGSSASQVGSPNSKRKFKLPKLAWKVFSGDPKDWLGFWGQFEKIHNDETIVPGDKFQYLLQAVEKGSRAGELVESFPPSASCYPKAIESLKNRFGRADILVEVYVRELLRLVLHNAMNSKQKVVLSSLYDKLETYLRALETLSVTTDKYAAMLYPLVESCLPEDVMRAWERSRVQITSANTLAGSDPPNQLTLLMSFLRTEVEGEERISMARKGFGVEKEDKGKKPKSKLLEEVCPDVPTAAGLFSGSKEQKKKPECIFCGRTNHVSQACMKAKNMTSEERSKIVANKKCCYSCLKPGHNSRDCRGNQLCRRCGKKHYEVMCKESPKAEKEGNSSGCNNDSGDHVLANQNCTPEVLMQTLLVRLLHNDKELVVRAVIDSGSQRSYIREDAARALGYASQGEEKVKHNLFGGLQTKTRVHQKYQIRVSSMDRKYRCTFSVLDETEICGDLPVAGTGPWMEEMKTLGIVLADCEGCTQEIQLLIGIDVCKKLETGQKFDFACGPSVVETHLGWTLCGKAPGQEKSKADSTLMVTSMFVRDADVQDLWKLDTIGITDPAESKTREELQEAAMDYFLKTVKREPSGRYEVSLPWISGHRELPKNKFLAMKRLTSATKKIRTEGVMEAYQKIFDNWEEEGVIEKVPQQEVDRYGHYLPHRAVLKRSSETTPVRPVFDASAKEKFSPSLNDCLEKGPNLLELIPDVLTRFRMEKIGVVADIKKAFLQISIRPEDRDYLRFLWWEDASGKDEKLKEYRHRRVVFGVSSSPFLLGATINFHLEKAPVALHSTAKRLKNSFYVDNCITSLGSPDDVTKFKEESIQLMSDATFDLRGWITSEEEGIPTFPVLGLSWDLKEDRLSCDCRGLSPEVEYPVTKRKVLSAAHGVFDPVGFSCPVTLFPKLLLQESWELKLGWDEELPEEMSKKFLSWLKSLPLLKDVKIPRWLFAGESKEWNRSLHVFVDASKDAYAACVFMRSQSEDMVSVQLVLAKSRVAPVKKNDKEVSIPRLELLACCIGARLASSVKKILESPEISTRYWTDSSNALSWIQKDEQWATFVANRVKEIRMLSDPLKWNHIPGSLNPADRPSRGCTPKQLLESAWWEGPIWLRGPEDSWPKCKFTPDDDVVNAEKRKTIVAVHLAFPAKDSFSEKLLEISGNYKKILRCVAYLRRFCFNYLPKDVLTKTGRLEVQEIEDAEDSIARVIQKEVFGKEHVDELVKGINVFKDQAGLVRVKTKLQLRKDDQHFKNPIVLPPQHKLVKVLIEATHRGMCHAGVQTVQCTLREKFWIVRAKKTIREVIRSCLRCRKFDARHIETAPATLPQDRVRDAAAFETTGVDLAGPLYLKGGEKTWIVLFTCAVYRAVHLELVTSLSTEAFLQALRRFIARRGRPVTIYSDNGSNFIGAVNLFRGLDWKIVEKVSTYQKIQWRFIPPTGAWWGGWWERLIQSTKRILRRVLGRAALSYEELLTVLCDCESVLNNRPLTYVSEDVEDLVPLTPAMFLQDVKQGGVADMDALDGRGLNRRAVYQQTLRDDLRKRFRVEYLGMLVGPGAGKKKREAIRPGEIVLIGDDNHKRLDWSMAKVEEVFPGSDGVVRVARVKTQNGELIRPVQRLFPLEVSVDYRKELIQDRPKVVAKKSPQDVPVYQRKEPVKEPEVVTRSGRKVKAPERLGI